MSSSEPLIRAPLQSRSRQPKERVLHAGLDVLREQVSDLESLTHLSPREHIERVVALEASTMLAHADVLGGFICRAPINPEIWQRGAEKSQSNAAAENLLCTAALAGR